MLGPPSRWGNAVIANWSDKDAARRVCEALAAKHGIQSLDDARRSIAFTLHSYSQYRRYQELLPGISANRRRELLAPLQGAIEALKTFECGDACERAFAMSQRDLCDKLEDLHRWLQTPIVIDEDRYRRPRNRPTLKREDQLIMELARAYSCDLKQQLETRLAKGQIGFNPAFITMLEEAHKALPRGQQPCGSAGEFVRRAKKSRKSIVADAATYWAWPF